MRARGPPSGTQLELRITTEADRPQVKPIPVMTFRETKTSRSKGALQDARDAGGASRAGTSQQPNVAASRTRRMRQLMKTVGDSRIEMDDVMRQNSTARFEASVDDEPMSGERGEGQGNRGASSSSRSRDDDATQWQSGSGSEQQGASSSSSAPMERISEQAVEV